VNLAANLAATKSLYMYDEPIHGVTRAAQATQHAQNVSYL